MIDWKKVFLGLPLLLTACAAPQTPAETKTVWVMDTACTISLHGGSGDAAAQRLSGLDQMLDNYDPDSDISRLNATGALSGIPEDFSGRLLLRVGCVPADGPAHPARI